MKGKITLAILEAIAEIPARIFDGFAAFLQAGHGASYGRIMQKFDARQNERETRAVEARLRHQYHNLIAALKHDGLIIEHKKEKGGRIFRLTAKGKEKLAYFRKHAIRMHPPRTYPQKESDVFTIIAFDIPEREKWKREWLRETLRWLGLKMIQKSVWIGKVKIPQQLLDDLKSLRLLESVEIFQITKTGTLRHLA